MTKWIMKRTDITCPECFKKKLIHEKGIDLYCDECGTEFYYTDEGSKTFRYKGGLKNLPFPCSFRQILL